MKNLIYLFLFMLISSCSSPNCTNNIQDGTETGIDCGGSCPPCPAPAYTVTELALKGLWLYDYKSYIMESSPGVFYYDTTFSNNGPGCKIDFTFEKPFPTHPHYYSYGGLGGCNYSNQTGWWINPSSGYLNDNYIIETLTSNLLILQGVGYIDAVKLHYHK